MTFDEYFLLFHKLELNRVAFTRLIDCHDEVLKLVNAAIECEREACIKACEDEIVRVKPIYSVTAENCVRAIRAREVHAALPARSSSTPPPSVLATARIRWSAVSAATATSELFDTDPVFIVVAVELQVARRTTSAAATRSGATRRNAM